MIRVIVCDDHKMLLDGITQFLGKQTGIEIIGTFDSVNNALTFLENNKTDVILTDISFPERDGYDLQEVVRVKYPKVKTIFLSMHDKAPHIKKAIRLGAVAYLLKESPIAKIADTIHRVYNGEKVFPCVDLEQEPVVKISNREAQILKKVEEGLDANQIAESLNISVLTVNTHKRNIYAKFNVNNAQQLIHKAKEAGILKY